ncbi:GHKL domain-containing protein [Microcoleus sp. FACHB-1515]|uniref:ATP-binding protein n=1 Tax=Cyanophyceae TaxID=3028117 RepID=UPI0016859AF2|nr:ATP-binding protein [Microcoleus sp. FACHB-1515]MBD2092168.1 GHKL domain-containing protein [Microcoleus sp. FACHB-1515]
MKAFLPSNEEQRLKKLRSYEILDSIEESAYDDVALVAAHICETPIALISLVDRDRQWFKSRVGIGVDQTHRDLSFCSHAILMPDRVLVVSDAQKDDRFTDNSLVTDAPKIRFYAGAPLVTPDGFTLGTLCVIDFQPRQLTDRQTSALQALSRQIVAQLELRRNLKELAQETVDRQQAEAQVRRLNAELEARVQQRTAQLQLQTQELQHTLHQLQQTQTQLIHAEKIASLGQLVAGVAHEINNPLSFISGNLPHVRDYMQNLLHLVKVYQNHFPVPPAAIATVTEQIELDYLSEDLPKLLNSLQVGADRIREIVDSLRQFSRSDERHKLADLHVGLDNTLMLLRHRLKATSTRPEIRVDRNDGDLPPIACCIGQLNQVFMNLISNAIDAIDARHSQQPQLSIRTFVESDRVCIAIADNGTGMDASLQKHIFDPFFTTKPLGKGTGLGLSISYQIVMNHDGQLICRSSLGSGTEFTIELPMARARDSAIELAASCG